MFLKKRKKIKLKHILLAVLPGLLAVGFLAFANPDSKMIIDSSLFGKIVIDPNNSSLGKATFHGYTEDPSCVYGWIDQDGDGYPAVASTFGICYDPATPGFVTTIANPTIADCYDLNDEAFPGQEEYFSTTRGTEEQGYDFAGNTWNSFDYNCNGIENRSSNCEMYSFSDESNCYEASNCEGSQFTVYNNVILAGDVACGVINDYCRVGGRVCYKKIGAPPTCETAVGLHAERVSCLCTCR